MRGRAATCCSARARHVRSLRRAASPAASAGDRGCTRRGPRARRPPGRRRTAARGRRRTAAGARSPAARRVAPLAAARRRPPPQSVAPRPAPSRDRRIGAARLVAPVPASAPSVRPSPPARHRPVVAVALVVACASSARCTSAPIRCQRDERVRRRRRRHRHVRRDGAFQVQLRRSPARAARRPSTALSATVYAVRRRRPTTTRSAPRASALPRRSTPPTIASTTLLDVGADAAAIKRRRTASSSRKSDDARAARCPAIEGSFKAPARRTRRTCSCVASGRRSILLIVHGDVGARRSRLYEPRSTRHSIVVAIRPLDVDPLHAVSAAGLPDPLRGPAARPLRRRELAVGRRRVRRPRSSSTRSSTSKPLRAQHPDPLARRQHPVDGAVVERRCGRARRSRCCSLRVCCSFSSSHVRYSSGCVQQNASSPPGAQHAGALGHDDVGIAEAQRAVVAEHDVERTRRRTAAARRSPARASGTVADARRACASCAGETSRPTTRAPVAASAIDHCAAPQPSSSTSRPRDVAEHLQLRLRDRGTRPTRAGACARSSPCAAW